MKRILLLCFVLLTGVSAEIYAQGRTVTGKVTSEEDGSAIPGVNVVLAGTSTGTVTDVNGAYNISVPEEGGVLQFSFIGLISEEVEIGNRSVIDITMKSDVRQLSEIVVTGFGIERAANEVTYQTEKVNSEELMQGQQQVVAAGLAGKVAGLQINVQDNGVNPQTQILLRGLRSISQNNSALIVIDGSIASNGAFSQLNANDIESIDVLKGANAAAIYGSQAANGALIVTTKQGERNQRFTVGYNTSYTLDKVSYLPEFQTEHGIGWDGHYDRIENTNWGPRFDGVLRPIGPSFPDGYVLEDQVVPYAPIKDNLKDFYETGTTFQNTFYLSGGDETGSFYMSYGRVDTKGIVPLDEYQRNTFRLNANKTLGKLTLGINSSYVNDDQNIVGQSIGDQDRTLYWFVLNAATNIPVSKYKDWDNPESYAYADNYYNAYYQNPYWAVNTNRDNDNTNRLVGNINAKYEITDKINLSGRIGIDRRAGQGKEWRDAQEYDPDLQPAAGAVSSYLIDSEFQTTEANGQVLLSGNFKLNNMFTLKPIIGTAFLSRDFRTSTMRANNLSVPGFYDISNGTGSLDAVVDQQQKRTFGVFADLTFGYRDWAYLNLTGRQDYTSTLPKDDNGYFYPSASVGVVLSEAIPAITASTNGIVSFLKVTFSNSTVYNDPPVYAINERFLKPETRVARLGEDVGKYAFPYKDINGFSISTTTVDPNLKKEKLNTWEFGANAAFLDDRFFADFSYFKTITSNLITYTTPSYASSALSYLTNIGELKGSGYEITLGGSIIRSGDFDWTFNVNYTSAETVVQEIKDDIKEVAIDNYSAYGTFAIVGKEFPQIKAQSYLRDPQGRVVINPENGNPMSGDVKAFGKTTPEYIIGASSKVGYKGISISATIDYRAGHVWYSQGNDNMEFTGRSMESVSADRKNFVFPNSSYKDGDGNYVANTNIPVSGGVMGFWQNVYNEINENYVQDASSFKLREVALNYTLPKSILSKTNGVINKLTIGFIGRNLLMLTPDSNTWGDPDFRNTHRVNDDANGIGIGGYFQGPPTRSYGFNLNIEF